MKFRFCGELDCPDWVLAEIATLSKITSIKMKMLCNQVVNSILGTVIDFDKIAKITSDAKYETGDIKASISSLTYIFSSAVKNSVEGETLSNELQQLGLPRESTLALCRVFSEKFTQLQDHLKKNSIKFTELCEVKWRVDYILSSSVMHEVNEPNIVLSLKVKEHLSLEPKIHCFAIAPWKAKVLLHELKQVQSRMEELSSC